MGGRGGRRVREAASQIYHAGFPYPWRHSPFDVEQVLNSFAIIIYIIRLSILSYCSLLIRLSPKLGYNLKSLQMFCSFIWFAAARLNASFMDFIHLQCKPNCTISETPLFELLYRRISTSSYLQRYQCKNRSSWFDPLCEHRAMFVLLH